MNFIKGKITDHFNKLLLAVLFVITVGLAVHLMHKQDAGGDDAGFIVWAETQAAFVLGRLLGMMPSDAKAIPEGTTTAATTVTTTESTKG